MKNPLFSPLKAQTITVESIEVNRSGQREALFLLQGAKTEIFRRHSAHNIEAMLKKIDRMLQKRIVEAEYFPWKRRINQSVEPHPGKPDRNKMDMDARDKHLRKVRVVLKKALADLRS